MPPRVVLVGPMGAGKTTVAGLLGEAWGLRAVFAIMAVLTLSLLVGLIWVTNNHIAEAEEAAENAAR